MWKTYLEHLDEVVMDGLFNCVHCSLQYLLDNLNKDKPDLPPLLETKLELQTPEFIFQPSLEPDEPDSFFALIEELLDDIFHVASLVSRVAAHRDMTDYLSEVEELAELLDMREEVMARATAAVEKAVEHRNSFDEYAYLWVDDRQEFLRQFLLYGHVLTTEEVEQAGEDGVPESHPSLDQFKEQVDGYEKIHVDMNQFKVSYSCVEGVTL